MICKNEFIKKNDMLKRLNNNVETKLIYLID